MASVLAFTPPADAERAVLQMAALTYGHSFESPDHLAAYMRALSDLPPAAVVAACDEAVRSERYFPRPSVLRTYAKAKAAESAPKPFHIGETWTNPETGAVELLFTCRDCQDTGWVQAGPPKRNGIEAAALALYTSVRRCECKRRPA